MLCLTPGLMIWRVEVGRLHSLLSMVGDNFARGSSSDMLQTILINVIVSLSLWRQVRQVRSMTQGHLLSYWICLTWFWTAGRDCHG